MKFKKYLTEVEQPLSEGEAKKEAARCLGCPKPMCSTKCPAGTDPGAFIKALKQNDIEGAAKIIRTNNILAGVCARVCPYENMCEGACVRRKMDKPIQIGKLQRYVTDYERMKGMKVLEKPEQKLEKVALIGSGPAALTVATNLALKGYRVTIFESRMKAGGIMTYGIAPFRLPQEVVDSEIQIIKDLGVEFRMNTHVGRDVSLDDLKKEGFKAFLIAIGRPASKQTDIKGIDLAGVVNALEYLYTARLTEGKFESGKNVVIIGAGNVAMDCSNTAKILDAEHVTVIYRKNRNEMPASRAEVKHADKLGVEFLFHATVTEITGKDGRVTGVKGSLGGGTFEIPADHVIFAIGQDSKNIDAIVEVKKDGNNQIIINDKTFLTSTEGVFAAGDSVNGGKTVVQAIAEGKLCADAMDRYLTAQREESKK